MRLVARLLACSALFLAGCGVAHDAAVGSYRVVTAPLRLFHHSDQPASNGPSGTTVTTTHTEVRTTKRRPSPHATPAVATTGGRPTRYVASSSPTPKPKVKAKQAVSAVVPKSNSASAAPNAPVAQEFPTANPVPGKPGYVFSPSEPTKYVDVSGYSPGSKVKDPYSGKIFLVP